MKKILLFFCVSALVGALSAGCEKEPEEWDNEHPFYYTGRSKQYFDVLKDRVIIKTTSDAEADKLSELDIFISDDYPVDAPGVWVIAPIDPEKTTLDDILKLPGVVDATYGLDSNGGMSYPTDQISVQFGGHAPEKALEKIGVSKNVVSVELDPLSGIHKITLNVKLGDILRTCCRLYESKSCEWAEPNFFRDLRHGK